MTLEPGTVAHVRTKEAARFDTEGMTFYKRMSVNVHDPEKIKALCLNSALLVTFSHPPKPEKVGKPPKSAGKGKSSVSSRMPTTPAPADNKE